MAVIRGTDGIIQIGPTNAPTEIGYVREWAFTSSREVLTGGPYINNDTIEQDVGAKTGSGTLTYDIPIGVDNGYKQLRTAYEAGTAVRLLLQSDDGEQVEIAAAKFTEMARTLPADGVYNGTASFIPTTGYTVIDTP